MRTNHWVRLLAVFALIGCAPVARADVISGPAVDSDIPALKVPALTSDQEYEELEYREQRGDKPTIYVFVRADAWDRPMARFLKVLDGKIKSVSDRAEVIAVWKSEDPQAAREYLPRARKSLQFANTTLAYFPADSSGANDWGINSQAFLTTVVVHKGKVAATNGYVSINETDVPKVVEALQKAVGP